MHIGIVVGTNRRSGLSHKLCDQIQPFYVAVAQSVDCIDLRAMPAAMLDPDAYKTPAPQVRAMVERFVRCDGVLFIVPEYNGSYPGALKLLIDMLPYPQGFQHRPCAFIGLASGRFHGLRAVEHLQAVAGYRNAYIYPHRVFIGESHRQFDADGRFVDAGLEQRLRDQAAGFVAFTAALAVNGGPAKEL
jgi:NAD(P)H-dependent FMN reductase